MYRLRPRASARQARWDELASISNAACQAVASAKAEDWLEDIFKIASNKKAPRRYNHQPGALPSPPSFIVAGRSSDWLSVYRLPTPKGFAISSP